jgi:hypothetical protein
MVKRFRIMEILAVFVLTCCLVMAYFDLRGELSLGISSLHPHFLVYGFPRDKYWAQAFKVEEAASSVLPPPGDIMRDHIAAYAPGGERGFLTHPNELEVYNVPDVCDQEKIIDVVRQCIRRDHMIPMQVDFYEEQRLPDGHKAGGPATLTRSILVQ